MSIWPFLNEEDVLSLHVTTMVFASSASPAVSLRVIQSTFGVNVNALVDVTVNFLVPSGTPSKVMMLFSRPETRISGLETSSVPAAITEISGWFSESAV